MSSNQCLIYIMCHIDTGNRLCVAIVNKFLHPAAKRSTGIIGQFINRKKFNV